MPIEISNRELIWRTLFCMKASLRGIECYLGTKREINYLMDKVGSFIYLDKGFHNGVSQPLYQKVKENQGIIISLDEEGAIDFEDHSTLSARYDYKLFEEASSVFFWGADQLNNVAKNIPDISKAIVTGHPRFEYLKPEYHFLYESKTKRLKKKYGQFILINTNMGFGNNYRGKKFIIDNYGGRFKSIKSIINNDEIKLEGYIKLVKSLSMLETQQIIIRPHPEEDIKTYEDAFHNYENVRVIYDGSAIPWILASNIMIHPDCTTGVESLMLGKEPISFLPKGLDESLLTVLPILASYKFNSEKKLIEFINADKFVHKKVIYSEYEWLNTSFSFLSNISNMIIAEIIKVTENIDNKSTVRKLTLFKKYQIRLRHYYNQINSPYDNLLSNKLKGFYPNNVTELVFAINKKQPNRYKSSFCKINKHLFYFS